uniref:Uncharacterized protein LOC114346209 n=1 Tax=Diabrotica virgifera virgifera TaxID=50390 RepID=A0A6P7GSI9_DIAVI
MLNSVKMDLKDLCRLCLSRDRQLMWVFDDSLECTTHAKKLILSTVGVEINKDDVISQKICSKCGENVLKLYTFREQSLKNDKLLKELHRNVRKKTMHKSVINLFKKYPGLKIPNVALDLNISPMVVMDMDGVQNYLRTHNKNMAKHTQEVLRNESTKAGCSSKDFSVSTKDTVSPISLKLVQNTSSYEIIHKTNTTEDDGRLQQEIINLLSSPVAKRISSYGKRRNSLPDGSPPHKRFCEASTSHQSISHRRRSHSNSKSEHLNNQKKVDVNKSPVIISNILIQTGEERDKSSNGAKQSNQTAGTHADPEIPKSNQREKLDSSIYTNINGIKPLSSTIVIDKTLCNDRQITSNLQLKKTSETHDSQIPKSDSLNRSEGATEHQVPIVDSTCPNSPPEIVHNIALSSSDISEKSVTECNFKENAMTNPIGTRKKPTDVVSDRDACNKLDFNRDFSPKKLKITEPESKIEISSPQIIEVDLSSEDETSQDLSISFNTKNNLNNIHICTFCTKKCETKQDLLAHSSSCVPKNNATADSSRALEKQSEVTKNQNSNVDTRNENSTEVVPEIIEILSDDEQQATSNITSSVIIPNITMPDNEFIDIINSNSDSGIITNQLLSAIKDLPCPEKETQTNISSHRLFDKLQEDFKIILNDESVTPNFDYRIKMQRFKAFLHFYLVPCIITNGKQFSVKYIKEQVQPKQELKYWDNLTPIDIKLKNSYVKLEPPEADDDQVLNPQEKISADGIEPQISHVDNAAVNVTNIPKVTPEISLNPTLPTPVPLESFPPTLLAQVSAESVEMTQSSNSINVCLPQSTENQKTQEITLNDPGLEIDIDATIRLNTEELAKLLDISAPSSNCNNNSSNSTINSSHNINVTPPIEANLRNVPLPTPFPTFSNENVPVVLPSTAYPSLPELGLNIENFDSYIEAPVLTQNLPIHTNSFIDSHTSNSTSTRLPDVLSTIPRPPAESLGSQNIHLNGANNNILSNATELENIVRGLFNTNTNTNNTYNTDPVPSNTDVRRNNNFPNNPSNYQYYQQRINVNMNVYNNNSRQTPDTTPRNAYYRSQAAWVPPEQTNGYSQTALPPPPPYTPQHHQNHPQQGFPSSYGTIPTISNNRNYNSNPPLNNYRQVTRPQSNNRNCYTPYPPNNSTNSVQRNSNNQNYGYFSQRMQSLLSMRNNAPRVPEPSNIRVRSIDDLR